MRITFLLKTFLRDPFLRRCLATSLTIPGVKVAVADDGVTDDDMPAWKRAVYATMNADGHFAKVMPFDSGVGPCRNMLVREAADTPYVMVGDDDFDFSGARLDVLRMTEFLDDHPEYDLCGGRVRERGESVIDYQGFIDESEPGTIRLVPLTEPKWKHEPDGTRWHPVDLTLNFFVARTDAVRAVPWSEEMKVAYEHESFFIDFKRAGKKVAFMPDAVVTHKPPDVTMSRTESLKYKSYRHRRHDENHFFRRYGIERYVAPDGTVATPPGPDA